jgi:hypothetical protein
VRDAQRRAGTEPNLTRRRLRDLFHERDRLRKDEARGTYGTRRRIGNKQIPVWSIPLTVLYPDTSAVDQYPKAVLAIHNLRATPPHA